jgi:carboxyl-terminal processing protease
MPNMNTYFKKVFLLCGSFLLIIPNLALADFKDVPKTHPDYEAISAMEKEGVIKGFADGTFKPDQLINRAELLKLTFVHIGYKPADTFTETPFTDVPAGSWFAPYVKKALELGSISLTPSNPKFFPDAPINRIEALKMVIPLEGIPAPYIKDDTPLIYSDVKPDAPYAYLVKAAQNAGLFSLNKNLYFFPFKNLSRAEAAELMYRAQIFRESLSEMNPLSGAQIIGNSADWGKSEIDLINNPKFPIFISVWNKINQQYFDQEKIDQNKLVFGAVKGMVDTLDDPYSTFELPENASKLENSLEGTYEGIGTVLDTLEDNFIIIQVLKDSPAEKAGIKAGDIITKVDDKDITGMPSEQVIDLIKGPAGTKINLSVLRDGKTLQFSIVREQLNLDSVVSEENKPQIPADLAYISIYQFTSTTADEFDTVLKTQLANKPKGIILDLRDNPGGYLDAAYKVIGHFIPSGKTLMNIKIAGQTAEQLSEGKGELEKMPLVVLVNSGSASAAEVLAGAIQDYKIGKLVGEKTYGKGTVQEITTYSDGSLFKLSIAYWLTPLKRDINKIGLTPDVTVEFTKDDLLNHKDPQLEKAISLLE